ncbi:alpha/beta fold hydrolase [Luteibacter aegosomatissinici]|uniref:alpha/beta fold hydrolase n=1 Tax=Luteibacter aegosomatissinici TaxID=2911539 RepID=UPI001FF85A08|nr:alpha/beta hydrolase [Luteibacter aegosomatissinici]UPG92781.1 alpha/beta hydrolase [Luteibacter aegosomatissinici]
MKKRAIARAAALAAGLAVASFGASANKAVVPASHVILVHGAWADGSSWSKVIPLLTAKGLDVTAVQLPLTSLADDAATVKRAIALESGPVVLVGHSYGGAVITEAGNDEKVSALVYVAAFAPDKGQSAGSLSASVQPPPMAAEVRPDPNGFLKLTQKGIFEDFAQDVSAREKGVLFAAQAPTSVKSLGGNITEAAWHQKPSWYIVAGNDRAIPPTLEATMAKTIGATTKTIQASHVVMLSHPDEVAATILQAAGK